MPALPSISRTASVFPNDADQCSIPFRATAVLAINTTGAANSRTLFAFIAECSSADRRQVLSRAFVFLQTPAQLDQGSEQHCPLLVSKTGFDDQATEGDFFAGLFLPRVGHCGSSHAFKPPECRSQSSQPRATRNVYRRRYQQTTSLFRSMKCLFLETAWPVL